MFYNELDNKFEFEGKTICESCYTDMGGWFGYLIQIIFPLWQQKEGYLFHFSKI